ncbi:dihydroxyacetone kinase subunit DhaL [Natribacillus halophilus]|uniref:phosphoenolpyruvate--glycerone phosphotransferase n=1 Tax=Natribacillus halophilus TaxID=549003 RepID=A0A1G8KQQ3_9BACI|nr:dihydroxyacetone kinase subunit DhaL [Natribacillus halophilus]SDI45696.1 dihydroxyacetone kinase DhaL subunit [Natribacillus halophilus]
MDSKQAKQWMQKTAIRMEAEKDELSALDQALGDGDHGVNMARGFRAVEESLDEWDELSLSQLMQKLGSTLVSKVGGAAGPLYGTAFMRLGAAWKDVHQVDGEAWMSGMAKAVEGIAQRGKTQAGEGTLLDVWSPVAATFTASEPDWKKIEAEAKKGMEATEDMVVKKGRGALLGEKSVGHLDPGAVSSYYLFQELANLMKAGE